MSIEAIGNVSSQAAVTGSSNPTSSLRQDFKSLEGALLNGDLSGAQSAFASLQNVVSGVQASANSNSIPTQLGQSSSPLGQDMQAVSSALNVNDLAGAQKAFAKLQQDMQSAFQANGASHAHHGHHAHHAPDNDGGNTSAASSVSTLNTLLQSMSGTQSTGSTANDLMNALQSLAASNPKVAGDLINLVNDLNSTGKIVNTNA